MEYGEVVMDSASLGTAHEEVEYLNTVIDNPAAYNRPPREGLAAASKWQCELDGIAALAVGHRRCPDDLRNKPCSENKPCRYSRREIWE
uniref:Uncharacterized protein n=2 Tax=Oryza TaxID=4527 RepID=Q69ND1_ORYSJ|nr:hypothetical protein [Oryza sativa Japonica Group]